MPIRLGNIIPATKIQALRFCIIEPMLGSDIENPDGNLQTIQPSSRMVMQVCYQKPRRAPKHNQPKKWSGIKVWPRQKGLQW